MGYRRMNYELNTERFGCVKEITRTLKKKFKGIQTNSYGYCCNSDYDYYHKYINDDDYVCAKIIKGGMNNEYRYDKYLGKGYFELGTSVYFSWNLTNFNLEDVIDQMNSVANKYGYSVNKPENEGKCIELVFIKKAYEI